MQFCTCFPKCQAYSTSAMFFQVNICLYCNLKLISLTFRLGFDSGVYQIISMALSNIQSASFTPLSILLSNHSPHSLLVLGNKYYGAGYLDQKM